MLYWRSRGLDIPEYCEGHCAASIILQDMSAILAVSWQRHTGTFWRTLRAYNSARNVRYTGGLVKTYWNIVEDIACLYNSARHGRYTGGLVLRHTGTGKLWRTLRRAYNSARHGRSPGGLVVKCLACTELKTYPGKKPLPPVRGQKLEHKSALSITVY